MAEEDIQKLHSEIESLRQENQRLRIAASHFLEQENGLDESPVIEKDSILKVLGKQIQDLRQLNDQVNSMLGGYKEIQMSLGAILPALELQMEGWTNEVANLKKHIELSESAYATVVSQLENKLGKTRQQLKEIQKNPSTQKKDKEDPFTDLNIFGP